MKIVIHKIREIFNTEKKNNLCFALSLVHIVIDISLFYILLFLSQDLLLIYKLTPYSVIDCVLFALFIILFLHFNNTVNRSLGVNGNNCLVFIFPTILVFIKYFSR